MSQRQDQRDQHGNGDWNYGTAESRRLAADEKVERIRQEMREALEDQDRERQNETRNVNLLSAGTGQSSRPRPEDVTWEERSRPGVIVVNAHLVGREQREQNRGRTPADGNRELLATEEQRLAQEARDSEFRRAAIRDECNAQRMVDGYEQRPVESASSCSRKRSTDPDDQMEGTSKRSNIVQGTSFGNPVGGRVPTCDTPVESVEWFQGKVLAARYLFNDTVVHLPVEFRKDGTRMGRECFVHSVAIMYGNTVRYRVKDTQSGEVLCDVAEEDLMLPTVYLRWRLDMGIAVRDSFRTLDCVALCHDNGIYQVLRKSTEWFAPSTIGDHYVVMRVSSDVDGNLVTVGAKEMLVHEQRMRYAHYDKPMGATAFVTSGDVVVFQGVKRYFVFASSLPVQTRVGTVAQLPHRDRSRERRRGSNEQAGERESSVRRSRQDSQVYERSTSVGRGGRKCDGSARGALNHSVVSSRPQQQEENERMAGNRERRERHIASRKFKATEREEGSAAGQHVPGPAQGSEQVPALGLVLRSQEAVDRMRKGIVGQRSPEIDHMMWKMAQMLSGSKEQKTYKEAIFWALKRTFYTDPQGYARLPKDDKKQANPVADVEQVSDQMGGLNIRQEIAIGNAEEEEEGMDVENFEQNLEEVADIGGAPFEIHAPPNDPLMRGDEPMPEVSPGNRDPLGLEASSSTSIRKVHPKRFWITMVRGEDNEWKEEVTRLSESQVRCLTQAQREMYEEDRKK